MPQQDVIVIPNGKGGTGKTPTAVALAFTFARAGKRVLLQDVDPQGSASYHLLGLKYKVQQPTIYDLLRDTKRNTYVEPVKIRISRFPENPDYEKYFFLLPANDILSNAEVELTTNKAFSFQEHLAKLNKKFYSDFDIIIIDTPGSHIATFVIMAIAAARRKVLIPVKTELSHVEGSVDSVHLVEDIKENFNEDLVIWGILPTQFEAGNNHHQDSLDLLHTYFKDPSDPTGQTYYPVYQYPSPKRNHYNKATEYRCDVRETPNSGATELGKYWDQLAFDLLTKEKAPIDEVRMARIQGKEGAQ